MLARAQDWLQTTVARMEITVESNPSSNLVIGDLNGLDEHPVFRIAPRAGA